MNVNLTGMILYWSVGKTAYNYYTNGKMDLSEINKDVENLVEGQEACLKMLTDRKKLSDEEFYEYLMTFADVFNWDNLDCYKVLELAHGLTFKSYARIKTTMTSQREKEEGQGRDYRWWTEEVGIDYEVLYTEEFEPNLSHIYSKSELSKLIEDKKIVLVSERERELDLDEEEYNKEQYHNFNIAYNDNNREYEFFNKDGKYYPYTLKYIRNNLSKKDLIKLYKKNLEHVKAQIYGATHKKCWNSESRKVVVEEYKKEFESKGYAKRLKKLEDYNIKK